VSRQAAMTWPTVSGHDGTGSGSPSQAASESGSQAQDAPPDIVYEFMV
jgi:hypothetical protein